MLKGIIITAVFLGLVTPAAAGAPPFTQDQVNRGTDLYIENCVTCHGMNLSDGQVGAPLRGALFRQKWEGKPLAEIMQFMSQTMPPEDPGYFYPDEYADLLAYILKRNGFEAGPGKLPEEMDALKDVILEW